jgi:hypothetical protein
VLEIRDAVAVINGGDWLSSSFAKIIMALFSCSSGAMIDKSGKVRIQQTFDYCYDCHEGLAAVRFETPKK